MKTLCLLLTLLAASAACAAEIPDLCADAKAWVPQFGSPAVATEKQPDGSTCLVLSGTYKGAMDRLCWDYVGPLDLSQLEAASVEMRVDRPDLAGQFGIYFESPGGWYARIAGASVSEKWQRVTWQLDDFGVEDSPSGWDKVDRFRFSLWGAAAGPITIRLRGFKAAPRDLNRNYLRNGSFEVPGPLPYGWGSGHWGLGNLPWAANTDMWRRHFGLDKTVAHDGQCSLRLVNSPDLPKLQANSVFFGLRDKPATTYTLSAWLKADRPDMPVVLNCGVSATVKVGTQWQRALLEGIKPGAMQIAVLKNEGDGTLWIDSVQIQAAGQDTQEFHPHSDDPGLAEREATVDWSAPRRTTEVANAPVPHRQPITTAAKVTIDQNGRFLLDGKPYLQHSLGLEFISDLGMIDAAAAAGFPDVCIEVRASITTEELKSWFDRCAQLGLHVIPWLDGNIEIERFKSHLTTLRNHPALLCWYVYDEPSGERFAEADRRLKLAHELDPGHPALINYLGDKLTGHMGDIFSTDIYPIPHGTPLGAIQGVAAMAAAAGPEHKPVWMWLQGTGYAYWMDREPTPREISCMVYGSLIAGARGIYWFAQVPRSAECWAEMRAMCVEIARLAPVLSSPDAARTVKCSVPSVMVKSYRSGTETWVLAVNTRREPCEAPFTMLGVKGSAEVVFEGRQVNVSSGKWSDSFGPYERHVYRMTQ